MGNQLRGHKIECVNGEWVYSDTEEPTVSGNSKRACGVCSEHRTKEGHDACLGTLPGLMNACCGHGVEDEAYVQFLDGFSVHGSDAAGIISILKRCVIAGTGIVK